VAYTTYFATADNVITNLATVVAATADPILVGQYTGFAAVSAVTMYELAIKQIFFDFAHKKHKVLGQFTEAYFERINGRIGWKILRDDYVPRFGDKYAKRFDAALNKVDLAELKASQISIKSCYSNLILWRNEFAHQGQIPTNATFPEVQRAYTYGKRVIDCLASCMAR
jgi:hypothetical protein